MTEKTDTDRLRFISQQDIFGRFVDVEKDMYEYATDAAEERGHDEPTDEDLLDGLRRLLDAAMELE